MDMQMVYQQFREQRERIGQSEVCVVSLATGDGGKPGVISEVTRDVAAWLLLQNRARLAGDEETKAYHQDQRESRQKAEQERRERFAMINHIALPPAKTKEGK